MHLMEHTIVISNRNICTITDTLSPLPLPYARQLSITFYSLAIIHRSFHRPPIDSLILVPPTPAHI